MKQLVKQNPQAPTNPAIIAPKQSRSVRQEVRPMPAKKQDAYNKFVEEASQEDKDAFYRKLAGMLLKKSAA